MNYQKFSYVKVYWSNGNIIEYRFPINNISHYELIELHYIKYIELLPVVKCVGNDIVFKNYFPYRLDDKAKIFDKLVQLLGKLQ